MTVRIKFLGLLENPYRKFASRSFTSHPSFKFSAPQMLPIEDGYGEYILYSKKSEAPISKEIYNVYFDIVENLRSQSKSITDRSLHIQKEVQKMDSNADIAFIPRTLYELLYIREAIEEELQEGKICPLQEEGMHDIFKTGRWQIPEEQTNRCWHLCRYDDQTPLDDQKETLKSLAFRINQVAIDKLRPKEFFKASQIADFSENEIDFLKNHYLNFPDIFWDKNMIKTLCGCRGASINFGLKRGYDYRVVCNPMGIRNDSDAQIIRNAIALECDKTARNAHVLYRGGDLFTPNQTTSISWGTSLFGGAFLDGTACVFHYATEKQRKAHSLIIPKADTKVPFHLPVKHPIRHLFSIGEFHHARTKLSKETPQNIVINGICDVDSLPPFIYSSLDSNALKDQIKKYHSQATPLNIPLVIQESVFRQD